MWASMMGGESPLAVQRELSKQQRFFISCLASQIRRQSCVVFMVGVVLYVVSFWVPPENL